MLTRVKHGHARVVDLDAATVASLRSYRATRQTLSPDLVRDTTPVLSTFDGSHRHPDRFFRRFTDQVAQAGWSPERLGHASSNEWPHSPTG